MDTWIQGPDIGPDVGSDRGRTRSRQGPNEVRIWVFTKNQQTSKWPTMGRRMHMGKSIGVDLHLGIFSVEFNNIVPLGNVTGTRRPESTTTPASFRTTC